METENTRDAEETRRISTIESLAAKYDLKDLGIRSIAAGESVQEFNKKALAKMDEINKANERASYPGEEPVRYTHKPAHYMGGVPCDNGAWGRALEEYSLSRLLLHLTDPHKHEAGLEREVAQDVEAAGGVSSGRGIMVPWEVFGPVRGDLNHMTRSVTVGGSASNVVGTDLMAGSFIDILRARSRVMSLGPTVLPGLVGNVAIPLKSATATGYWFAADGSDSITASDQTYAQRTLTPKFLGALTHVSYKALLQSTPSLEALTRQDFIDLAAVTLDWAAIQGTGSNSQPTGVVNVSGINAVEYSNGGDPTWANVIAMETAIAADNADGGRLQYLVNPTLAGTMKSTDRGTDTARYLWENAPNAMGTVNGYTAYSSSNVPSGTAILADWSQLIVGLWGGVELAFDDGGTNFAAGTKSFRMIATIDLQVRQPTAFCTLTEAAP